MQNHILIVDDDAEARGLLQGALRNEGYQLSFATQGAEGLEIARRVQPDIVITDLMMPIMDGRELCRHLRSDALLSTVPILMLTSMNDRDSRLQGIEAGADDFLIKPCDRMELRTRLRTIMRLNRYRRLINEQRKFQWVVDQASEGYVLLNESGGIVYANACAREFLHLPTVLDKETAPIEFVSHVQRHYQCQPEALWAHWPPPTDTPESLYLVRSETRQSHALWLDVRTFHSPASVDGMLVQLRDVSNQVSLQRRTCTFEALVSHKLLSPLGTMGILPLLKTKLNGQMSADLMEFLDLAISSADKLQQQVQEIITYVETLNAVGLIQEERHTSVLQILTLLEAESEKQDIRLHTHVPHEFLKQLFSLSTSDWQTVFVNLLNNAKKFNPQKNPSLLCKIKSGASDTLILQLIDDGVHLPVEELDKVWRPYYQNEKSFTGEVAGMGLGLTKVAAIIWSAGGQCRLNNREDRPGVCISLTLPALRKLDEAFTNDIFAV